MRRSFCCAILPSDFAMNLRQVLARGGTAGVQHESTATLKADTDLIRPAQAYDLHERPTSTAMRLVRIEGIDAIFLSRDGSA